MRQFAVGSGMIVAWLAMPFAWNNGQSGNTTTNTAAECQVPPYATHDWIADHAMALLPDDERAWLEPHRAQYLIGTEAPDNRTIRLACGVPHRAYDDRSRGHSVEWNAGVTEMLNDRPAARAQDEYDKAVIAFGRDEPGTPHSTLVRWRTTSGTSRSTVIPGRTRRTMATMNRGRRSSRHRFTAGPSRTPSTWIRSSAGRPTQPRAASHERHSRATRMTTSRRPGCGGSRWNAGIAVGLTSVSSPAVGHRHRSWHGIPSPRSAPLSCDGKRPIGGITASPAGTIDVPARPRR